MSDGHVTFSHDQAKPHLTFVITLRRAILPIHFSSTDAVGLNKAERNPGQESYSTSENIAWLTVTFHSTSSHLALTSSRHGRQTPCKTGGEHHTHCSEALLLRRCYFGRTAIKRGEWKKRRVVVIVSNSPMKIGSSVGPMHRQQNLRETARLRSCSSSRC